MTSHALESPPPVTNCHTFSDPLERDVLHGRPLIIIIIIVRETDIIFAI